MQADHIALRILRNNKGTKLTFTLITIGSSLRRLFYVENCEDKKFENVTILDLSKDDKVQILQSKTVLQQE